MMSYIHYTSTSLASLHVACITNQKQIAFL